MHETSAVQRITENVVAIKKLHYDQEDASCPDARSRQDTKFWARSWLAFHRFRTLPRFFFSIEAPGLKGQQSFSEVLKNGISPQTLREVALLRKLKRLGGSESLRGVGVQVWPCVDASVHIASQARHPNVVRMIDVRYVGLFVARPCNSGGPCALTERHLVSPGSSARLRASSDRPSQGTRYLETEFAAQLGPLVTRLISRLCGAEPARAEACQLSKLDDTRRTSWMVWRHVMAGGVSAVPAGG